jgi:hypothetical protein
MKIRPAIICLQADILLMTIKLLEAVIGFLQALERSLKIALIEKRMDYASACHRALISTPKNKRS